MRFKLVSTIAVILGAVGLYIAYTIFTKAQDSRNKIKAQGKDPKITVIAKDTASQIIDAQARYPKDIQGLNRKALGGQPEFYNEADHSRGRFLGWIRTIEDRADLRVIEGNCYRARVLKDVKFMGFFKASKEELTPCVFRPNLDAIFKAPGEEPGVPAEGIVVFKRSLDGTKIAFGHDERYRQLLIDLYHQKSVMADMLHHMRERERLTGSDTASKELTDEVENKLKRSKRMHDAASGRSDRDLSTPYGQEMYGDEDSALTGQTGTEGLWKFEG